MAGRTTSLTPSRCFTPFFDFSKSTSARPGSNWRFLSAVYSASWLTPVLAAERRIDVRIREHIRKLALLRSASGYPCEIVIIGGGKPTAVRQGQLSGTVVGSGRIDLMGKSHDEDRSSITVAGATISVRSRTDTEFFKKGEVHYPPGVKPSRGNLKNWQCGSAVLEVRTNQAGQFTISQLKPGKYCLDITAPQAEDANQVPMHSSFIFDVVKSGPRTTLIANISPRWPDCSGGSSLELRPLH